MLEVTTAAQEEALGVDFTEIYKNSDLYRCVGQLILFGPCLRWQSLVSTVLIGFVGSLQEKQSFDWGAKQTFPRFKRSSFSNYLCTVVLHTVRSLPMETKSSILAQHAIHRSQTIVYSLHGIDIWNNVLGSWHQKVSCKRKEDFLLWKFCTA